MVSAILRSTVPLLPVLLVTSVCPSTRSVRLPARSGCDQQRGERDAGEEHVPPVVLAHLPTSCSLSVWRGCPFRPYGAIGRPAAVGIGRVRRRAASLPRPNGPHNEAPPGFAGGRLASLVHQLSRASNPRRPPSLPRPDSRARTRSCASFLSFRARRLVRLPPGTGCEQQRRQRGTRQEQMSPVDLRSHPITSFQYRFSIGDRPASPHRASVVFPTAPLPASR